MEGASFRRERRGLLHGFAPPHTSAHQREVFTVKGWAGARVSSSVPA